MSSKLAHHFLNAKCDVTPKQNILSESHLWCWQLFPFSWIWRMCSTFFSHIDNWNIAWTYSILFLCNTFLKQYSCPWRIHCVFLGNISLIWVRYSIKAIDYLGWVKTLFQVRVVPANQSKWSLGWSMGKMYITIYQHKWTRFPRMQFLQRKVGLLRVWTNDNALLQGAKEHS